MTCMSKEYKIKTKMVPQLKMLFLLGYNLKIGYLVGVDKNLVSGHFSRWRNQQIFC